MFYHADTKQYGSGSQTSNAIAVSMGLVDAKDKKAVIENIVKDIQQRNYSLTSGDIGFHYLLKVLNDAGRNDIIFKMNNRTDVPGYGYQIVNGATALTESWQGLPIVSNNHLMLGHLMQWFYEGLAGISQAANSVGYKNIVIRPQVVGDITHAAASFQSPYGEIRSAWKKTGSSFELNVTVPANTTADNLSAGCKSRRLKSGSGNYSYKITLKDCKVKKNYCILFFVLMISQNPFAQSPRSVIDFNKDWKFYLGNDSTAINTNYNDAAWRKLSLPHDWSIESNFIKDAPATNQGGSLPGGIGWYRKTFIVPLSSKDKNVSIEFDGVYKNSEVWINGHYLGKRPYGYSSFSYDLTPHLFFNKQNVIAVKVDNSQQPDSRWYTGSGIYRNVRLVINKINAFIKRVELFVTYRKISKDKIVP